MTAPPISASFSLKVEHGNTANLAIGEKSPCVGV